MSQRLSDNTSCLHLFNRVHKAIKRKALSVTGSGHYSSLRRLNEMVDDIKAIRTNCYHLIDDEPSVYEKLLADSANAYSGISS